MGIYGLSSYAFRVASALDALGYADLDFFVDSDSRLVQFSMGASQVQDKSGFLSLLDRARNQGDAVVVLVAAVNGHRIVDMLESEFQGFDLEVIALPPDCQNRTEGA